MYAILSTPFIFFLITLVEINLDWLIEKDNDID